MKKFLMIAMFMVVAVVSTGCATWDAVKQDSGDAWDSTKEAVHDATE